MLKKDQIVYYVEFVWDCVHGHMPYFVFMYCNLVIFFNYGSQILEVCLEVLKLLRSMGPGLETILDVIVKII